MITPEQSRAARGLLDWTQSALAEASGVSLRTIAHFEKGQRTPIKANLKALQDTFEAAGVIFTNDHGVCVTLSEKSD